jgi:hypothetical protein
MAKTDEKTENENEKNPTRAKAATRYRTASPWRGNVPGGLADWPVGHTIDVGCYGGEEGLNELRRVGVKLEPIVE